MRVMLKYTDTVNTVSDTDVVRRRSSSLLLKHCVMIRRELSLTKIEGSSSEQSCGSFTSPSSSLVASFPAEVTLSFSFFACLFKRKRERYPRFGYCVRLDPCCVSYRDYKREREREFDVLPFLVGA
jgi:hypothetical protein